jgi:hypothetical protein
MEYLLTLKDLQEKYQQKFAAFLKTQEESFHIEDKELHSPNCVLAKQEWITAGDDLRAFLDKNK